MSAIVLRMRDSTVALYCGVCPTTRSGMIFILIEENTMTKTYNSQDSHVVTHHTTNWPACGLSAGNSRVGAALVSLG